MTFRYQRRYTGRLQGVIFDWAGTTVDHGCFAPTMVFVQGFQAHGVEITLAEARAPMGLHKRDHIAAVLSMPRVQAAWQAAHGAPPTDADVQTIYDEFVPRQTEIIAQYSTPIPGVVETVAALRERGLKIGSCTGYVQPMMEALLPAAAEQGYAPDVVVTSDQVPAGRPAPWMALSNAMQMNAFPLESLVKVGDTVTDIEEGLNAGMWTVGVAKTGNELGMSAQQVAELDEATLRARLAPIYARLYRAGAHFVIDGVADIVPVLDAIDTWLARGERP